MSKDLNRRVAEVRDESGTIGWLMVIRGEMCYEGGERQRYLQMKLFDKRRGEAYDDFQDDPEVYAELEAQLSIGVLDWYGEALSIEWLDIENSENIRLRLGWFG